MSSSTQPTDAPKVMANWMVATISPPPASASSGRVSLSQVPHPTGAGCRSAPTRPAAAACQCLPAGGAVLAFQLGAALNPPRPQSTLPPVCATAARSGWRARVSSGGVGAGRTVKRPPRCCARRIATRTIRSRGLALHPVNSPPRYRAWRVAGCAITWRCRRSAAGTCPAGQRALGETMGWRDDQRRAERDGCRGKCFHRRRSSLLHSAVRSRRRKNAPNGRPFA